MNTRGRGEPMHHQPITISKGGIYASSNNRLIINKYLIIHMEEIKYIHIEDINECCICYEIFNEFFKCTRCTFFCCPRCFNNYYFTDNNNCPICRY